MAHLTSNTEKTYPCIFCGSKSANIIRESSSLESTRIKCNDCNGVYAASDSKELQEKGQLPDGPPVVQEPVQPASKDGGGRDPVVRDQPSKDAVVSENRPSDRGSVPRTPSFVFISKDRAITEFYTRRDLKKAVLSWEHRGVKYDVFELNPKKISAKVDIA